MTNTRMMEGRVLGIACIIAFEVYMPSGYLPPAQVV